MSVRRVRCLRLMLSRFLVNSVSCDAMSRKFWKISSLPISPKVTIEHHYTTVRKFSKVRSLFYTSIVTFLVNPVSCDAMSRKFSKVSSLFYRNFTKRHYRTWPESWLLRNLTQESCGIWSMQCGGNSQDSAHYSFHYRK